MTILQRYVLRELLGPLGYGLLVFTFIFLIGQLFQIIDRLLNSSVPVWLAGEYIFSILPGILAITIPMALLVGILLGIGRLAADREILAIRTSGVNLFHVCVPVLIFSACLAGSLIAANRRLVPYLNTKNSDLGFQIAFNVISSIPPNRPQEMESQGNGPSSTFYYDNRNPTTGEMEGVTIRSQIEHDQSQEIQSQAAGRKTEIRNLMRKQDAESKRKLQQLLDERETADEARRIQTTLIVAETGRLIADVTDRLISVNLTTGSMHISDPDKPLSYNIIRFSSFQKGMRPSLPRYEGGVYRKPPSEMTVQELSQRMNLGKKAGNYLSEYYQRYSIPLACIAFALIAIPLAIYVRPTGKAIAFAMSFLLILIYYGLLQYGISLGKTGSGLAPFAIFLPNILLSVVGSFLLYRMVMK